MSSVMVSQSDWVWRMSVKKCEVKCVDSWRAVWVRQEHSHWASISTSPHIQDTRKRWRRNMEHHTGADRLDYCLVNVTFLSYTELQLKSSKIFINLYKPNPESWSSSEQRGEEIMSHTEREDHTQTDKSREMTRGAVCPKAELERNSFWIEAETDFSWSYYR